MVESRPFIYINFVILLQTGYISLILMSLQKDFDFGFFPYGLKPCFQCSIHFLVAQNFLYLLANFLNIQLSLRRLILNKDNVIAELSLNYIADLPRLQLESSFFKFRNHSTASKIAEISSL